MEFKIINHRTAYLVLKTFDLTDLEKDSIAIFFKKICNANIKNLIIDIRNNTGGSKESIPFLLNFIADSQYRLELYSLVNKHKFDFFKYVENQIENQDLFEDYNFSKKDGKYYKNFGQFNPHKTPNFSGNLYVLTSERTLSASAILAGFIKKNKLGVTVGRETGSAFHHINAEKFANLVLPNSNIIIRIPLVKSVYDLLPMDDVGYGRGVLPDYPVDITLEELSMESGDLILKKTLDLISNNQYFIHIEKEQIIQSDNQNSLLIKIIFIAILIIVIFTVILHNRKR